MQMLVDAALKQVEKDVQKVQEAIDGSTAGYKQVCVKRAIASVDALKASLKTLSQRGRNEAVTKITSNAVGTRFHNQELLRQVKDGSY